MLAVLHPDVPGAHRGVLQVGPCLAVEVEGVVEIENDQGLAREPHHEVAQRADGDVARGARGLFGRHVGVPDVHFAPRLLLEAVEQVVGLHAQPLAPADLDVGALAVLVGQLRAQLLGAARRQRHDLVGEMHAPLGFVGVAQPAQPFEDDVLGVGLARVDDVEHPVAGAEAGRLQVRGVRGGRRAAGRPHRVAVVVHAERLVMEVLVQPPDLPELVGDVLAGVGHGAVRADEDLGVLLPVLLVPHDPAAGVGARRLQLRRAARLELGEGGVPEVQVQDVALPRQDVVADVEPLHGVEVAVDDPGGDQVGQLGHRVVARLDLVQHLAPEPGVGFGRFVETRHPGIQVPAQVVEPALDGGDLGDALVLQVQEADDHVSHLHAGVVDVVLHLHPPAVEAEQAHEAVAQDGVAQVPDVGRLVGIDVGVLHDGLAGVGLELRPQPAGPQRAHGVQEQTPAVHRQIDVAAAGGVDPADVGGRPEAVEELLGDLLGRPAQHLGQLERERHAEIAELQPGGILHLDAVLLAADAEHLGQARLQAIRQFVLDPVKHPLTSCGFPPAGTAAT